MFSERLTVSRRFWELSGGSERVWNGFKRFSKGFKRFWEDFRRVPGGGVVEVGGFPAP